MPLFRTYPMNIAPNWSKTILMAELFVAYRYTAEAIAHQQWQRFFQTRRFHARSPISIPNPIMSARYLQTCQAQVVGMLSSFLSNRANDFKRAIYTLDTKHTEVLDVLHTPQYWTQPQSYSRTVLLFLANHQAWYRPATIPLRGVTMQGVPIPGPLLRFARNIMRGILGLHRKPSMRRINLCLDKKVATVFSQAELEAQYQNDLQKYHTQEEERNRKALEKTTKTKGSPQKIQKTKTFIPKAPPDKVPTTFPYWIKLATLSENNPIWIPVQANPYYESIVGTQKAFIQLNQVETLESRDFARVHQKGPAMNRSFQKVQEVLHADIQAAFIKGCATSNEIHNLEYPSETIRKTIGIDMGMKNLMATSEGDILGQGLFAVIARYDQKIVKLMKNRQAQGLPIRCKRYDRLVQTLRSFLKNELHRVLNRFRVIHQVTGGDEVVVESLDFRSPDMSKRMNRLVQNFGRTVFRNALRDKAQQYGFTVIEVNAAYTSQTCARCGYVDAKNRKTRDQFQCKCCHHSAHADVNAAKICRDRRSVPELASIYVSHKALLDMLLQRWWNTFIEREGRYCSLLNEQEKRLDRWAGDSVWTNPYFSGLAKYCT